MNAAIEREKRIKGWTRVKKLELIRDFNSRWWDFAEDILGVGSASDSSPKPGSERQSVDVETLFVRHFWGDREWHWQQQDLTGDGDIPLPCLDGVLTLPQIYRGVFRPSTSYTFVRGGQSSGDRSNDCKL